MEFIVITEAFQKVFFIHQRENDCVKEKKITHDDILKSMPGKMKQV